ncbi:hypothetical protein D2Q93_15710 [Alicyclobacillaceae bacterium I2511]|nr:hypothetical protein D2Q93_15710 [Alicyclobacillaceae bacterium I2511]
MEKIALRRWYLLSGLAQAIGKFPVVEFAIQFVVESSSVKEVLKNYGGTRTYRFPDGQHLRIQFPDHAAGITATAGDWFTAQSDTLPATYVLPVTRYVCSCGQVHESEYPYPSMWCTCGQKAYPEHPLEVPIPLLHHHRGRQGAHV